MIILAISDDSVEYQLSVYTGSIPKLGLYDFLDKKKYTDVIFLVEGERFEAHKVILASQCAYFERYILHNYIILVLCCMLWNTSN